MAGDVIGRESLILVTDASAVEPGLAKAEQHIKSFKGRVHGMFGEIFGGSFLGSFAATLGTKLLAHGAFAKAKEAVEGFFDMVGEGWENIFTGTTKGVRDWNDALEKSRDLMQKTFNVTPIEAVEKAAQRAASTITKLRQENLTHGAGSEWEKQWLLAHADMKGILPKETQDFLFGVYKTERANQQNKFFDNLADAEDELRKQIETFGMSPLQAMRHQMSEGGGYTTDQLAVVDARIEKLQTLKAEQDAINEATKEYARLQEEGARIMESTASPLEKLQSGMEDLNALQEAGMINITQEARAAQKLADDFLKATGGDQMRLAPIMERGSLAAEHAISSARSAPEGDMAAKIKEAIKAAAKEQEARDEEARRLLQKIADKDPIEFEAI
jgi:hypothetical protein